MNGIAASNYGQTSGANTWSALNTFSDRLAISGSLSFRGKDVRIFSSSTSITITSGSGTRVLDLPAYLGVVPATSINAVVTERNVTTLPRFIFGCNPGTSNITIYARNIIDTSSGDDVDVNVIVISTHE